MARLKASCEFRIIKTYCFTLDKPDGNLNEKPLAESVAQLPPEEDPEEWPVDKQELRNLDLKDSDKEPEDRPVDELEELKNQDVEDSEKALDEWPVNKLEELGNQDEQDSEEDPEELGNQDVEDSEEEPEEGPVEEPRKELEEQSVKEAEQGPVEKHSHSGYNDNKIQQPIEYQEEDPLENTGSKAHAESGANEAMLQSVNTNSNEKKRSLHATPGESAVSSIHQSRKKQRQVESPKQIGSAFTNLVNLQSKHETSKAIVDENSSKGEEHTTSSGKRRRTRWEAQHEDGAVGEADMTSKRTKIMQAGGDALLKLLGPIQLSDFNKGFADVELEILKLKAKLVAINCKLQRSELQDDRPEDQRSPSPEPVYNNLGIRINTREFRQHMKLTQERQSIILRLAQINPTFKPPSDDKPAKRFKKLYIPVKEYPEYNFVGPIIGPRGNTQKRMQRETGAKILVRGKGALKVQHEPNSSDAEDLHVYIEADNQTSLDAAVAMVEKLLIPYNEEVHKHKLAQLQDLAQLNATPEDKSVCKVRNEEGHGHVSFPLLSSTFCRTISSDTCGGNDHFTACCSSTALSQGNSSPSGSSGLGPSSTPISQCKPNKEFSDCNLYVCHLPKVVDENLLKELFSPFGKIASVRVIKDLTTGLSKGYGFVNFQNPTDAAAAVTHLHGYKMLGKMLAVRAAGRPPIAVPSVSSLNRAYSKPAVLHPNVPSQTASFCLPGSTLQESQASFLDNEMTGLPSFSICTENGGLLPNSESTGYHLYGVSGFVNLNGASSSYSPYAYSPYLAPAWLPEFPGYSFIVTPTHELPSELETNQLSESELKRISCPIYGILQQEQQLFIGQSSESDSKPATDLSQKEQSLNLSWSSESDPKPTACQTTDLLPQKPPLEQKSYPLIQSTEVE